MCLVSDLPEARVLDQTFVQKPYVTADEQRALKDQLRGLEGSEELQALFADYNKAGSLEAKVARDADVLEALIEAREFMQQGISIMERWFLGKRELLMTVSGKRLFDVLAKKELFWWT